MSYDPLFIPPAGGPLVSPAWAAWSMRLVDVVNGILAGKQNNVGEAILGPSAGLSVVFDPRISPTSVILFMPLTATAATEYAGGAMYVAAQTAGQMTIAHVNAPIVDRQFRYLVVG